ncbi:MAG: hypothetical protein E7633_05065 [Ruminococcaceae bacterium]|nr:hypothetical protein [Oscillospiraceae bacterium]
MRLSVIDIGSNTIKTTVFKADGKNLKEISHKTLHAKLSSHIKDGRLSEKGISVLIDSVNKLKRVSKKFGCKKKNTFAFATACIRGASNRDEILRRLCKATKMEIRLLSGEEEAEMCFLGALSSESCPKDGVLADLGGGSCEFILFENSTSKRKVSLNVGALAMYKKFASKKYIDFDELKKLSSYLKNEFSSNLQGITLPSDREFIVTGGTARAAATLLEKLANNDNLTLPKKITLAEAKDLCEKITSGELRDITEEVVKDRAQTIVPGLYVLINAAEAFCTDHFTVVSGGARNGFASKTVNERKAKKQKKKVKQK